MFAGFFIGFLPLPGLQFVAAWGAARLLDITLTTRGPGAAAIVRDIPRWWPDALDRIVEELGA